MIEYINEKNNSQFEKLFAKSLKKYEFNDVRTLNNLKTCILLYKEGSSYVGFLTGYINVEPFSKKGIAIVESLYVMPSYRNEGKAYSMSLEFEKWSKHNDCDLVIGGLNIKNKKSSNFFEKIGFENIGTAMFFKKSIQVR